MAKVLTTEERDNRLMGELRKQIQIDADAYTAVVKAEEAMDVEYKEKKKEIKNEKRKLVDHAYNIVTASKALGIDLKGETDLLFYGAEDKPQEAAPRPKKLKTTSEDEDVVLQ